MNTTPARPPLLEPRFENIPASLRELSIWLCWKLTPKAKGGWTKVPVQARPVINDNRVIYGSSTDAATWATFAEAKAAYNTHSRLIDGVAVALDETLGLVGVDLDHVFTADVPRRMKDEFQRWVQVFASYCEVSPRGEGIRIICYGRLPGAGKNRPGYEIYAKSRMLTLTGHSLTRPPQKVRPRQDVIDLFLAELFPPPEPPRGAAQGGGNNGGLSRPRVRTYDAFDIRDHKYRLEGWREGANGWAHARCPAHGGEGTTSLAVYLAKGAFRCFAGCSPAQVRAALGYIAPPPATPRTLRVGGWGRKEAE